jgi:LmbE family N-acetylglucosaminyl deacetylase
MSPTAVHVAPHPDDEALGCPGVLLHLHDRGWKVVSVLASLGFPEQRARRRDEFEEASKRAGFVPVVLEPPLDISLAADLTLAADRVTVELPPIIAAHDATVVVSPSPHDVHHGHEAVGRGVRGAMATVPSTVRWWMWGIWGDLPVPNVYFPFAEPELARMLHVLEAYEGELERNDYRRLLTARAIATVVLGSERVFGFGSPTASPLPYAEVLTEVRRLGARWMASAAHGLDEGPLPDARFDVDLTSWVESPSVHQLVGPIAEVPASG